MAAYMSATPLAPRTSRAILLLVFSPQLTAYSTPFASILHTSLTTIAYGINESKRRLRDLAKQGEDTKKRYTHQPSSYVRPDSWQAVLTG